MEGLFHSTNGESKCSHNFNLSQVIFQSTYILFPKLIHVILCILTSESHFRCQTFCFIKISRFWQYFSWYTFQNFMWYMYSYVFWPQKAIFGAILMRRGIFNPLRHEKDCYFVTKYVFDSKSAYIYLYICWNDIWYMYFNVFWPQEHTFCTVLMIRIV